eukprot:scaffold207598_cov27-Tisochrysis_lutea.AAC.4
MHQPECSAAVRNPNLNATGQGTGTPRGRRRAPASGEGKVRTRSGGCCSLLEPPRLAMPRARSGVPARQSACAMPRQLLARPHVGRHAVSRRPMSTQATPGRARALHAPR